MAQPIHRFDRETIQASSDAFRRTVQDLLPRATEQPSRLASISSSAIDAAHLIWALERNAHTVSGMLRTAARTAAALFSLARTGGGPVELPVDGQIRAFVGSVEESHLHVGRWLNAVWAALVVADLPSLVLLCYTPSRRLRESSTRGDPLHYDLAEAVRRLCLGGPHVGDYLLQALRETEPSRIEVGPVERVLNLDVPTIEVFHRIRSGTAEEVNKALEKAVQLHRAYWEATDLHEPRSFLALPHVALAAVAAEHDLSPSVDSPYLPRALWEVTREQEDVVLCPYCHTPVAHVDVQCPGCLKDMSLDAPVIITRGAFRSKPRRECAEGEDTVWVLEGAVNCPVLRAERG